jgi:glycosyltransferase involved in cell wall biosynthesis
MPSIGLAVIAKNEEANVERWYESVRGLFDQVVFVDTGSTDKTVEIATRLGCEVHHFEWINDFSAARNFAFSKLTTDYGMWLDLDDVLDGREEFALWRDNVMPLADYWLATYNYALDATGRPTCSFVRERVFKMSREPMWSYPIHEGVKPNPKYPLVAQYTASWSVKHLRTAEDLKKDNHRNLTIFNEIRAKGKMDTRLRYYYGKELFEHGRLIEAVQELGEAMKAKDAEMHDRTLAMQYYVMSCMAMNQWDQAISVAMSGLQLNPVRAEFFTALGDCYIKKNSPMLAIPYYAAAARCPLDMQRQLIFSSPDHYGPYPLNQLAKLYFTMGNVEEARKIASDAFKKYQHPDSKLVLDECEKVIHIEQSSKKATPCDDIVMTCGPSPYEWDGELYRIQAMGGSETAAIEMAEWLHKLSGRPVKIFNMRQAPKVVNGVEYYPQQMAAEYFSQHKPFFHIAWRHNLKVTDAPTFVWSHDLTTQGVERVDNYDRVLALTPFHKYYLMTTQGVPEHKIAVTRNGLNPDKFKGLDLIEKEPLRFVFGSSPDRGLVRAIKVLDKVREAGYPATLHIYYGYEHLHKYGLGALADQLKKLISERPWITYHGKTEQRALMEGYAKAQYCVQPSDWIETSMLSAVELMSCGVYMIIRKVGGVADTLARFHHDGMAKLVDSNCETDAEFQVYVDETIAAIKEERWKSVKFNPEELSWEKVAKEWLEDLPKMFGTGIAERSQAHEERKTSA